MTIDERTARLVALHLWPVVASVSREHRVAEQMLLGTHRLSHVVRARHHLWALIRDTLDWSYPAIAAAWGAHHTSIMHGCKRHWEMSA